MKAVGCIATLCLLVTYLDLGTCQATSPTAAAVTTPAATTPAATTPAATTPTVSGQTQPSAGPTSAAPASTAQTTPPPVAVGLSCSGDKTCVTGAVCDTTCKLAPGGSCASNATHCQTGTNCTTPSNTCDVLAGLVGFGCTVNSNCTTANSECDTTTTQKCKCKSGITTNTINLTCPSGSATVMASVLVLAVAFVKTQLF